MKRRQALTAMGATALIAPEIFTASLGLARAQARPLTFCSWGGALSEMEKTTMLDPFAKLKGLEFAYASPTNYAKIKAMVESGAPEWDMVDVGGFFIWQGKALLETLDMSLIPNAKKLDPGWVTSKGIFTSTGATVMAWNTNAFPANKGPTSWKDFWDIKAFPGPRGLYKQLYYNYEAALLAAGVPLNEVYPATDEKIKLVFQKLREIKPHVKVWWTAGAQPGQLLSSGELALCSAWTGRILSVMKEKAPVAMTYSQGIAWGNAWVVLKGAPNAKLAMEAINYSISEEAQLRLLDNGTYGPSLSTASAKATADQRKVLVTAPENAKQMVITDEEQVAIYREKYEAEWNKFLLS